MAVNPGYTRRKELRCTVADLATYSGVILYEGEVLYVKQADNSYAIKVGDGVTNIANLPYTVNYSEIAGRATAAANSATAAAGSATTAGNKALDAEAWANGTRGGSAIGSSDAAYQKNSKYWADVTEGYKNQASTIARETAEEVLTYKFDKRDPIPTDLELDEEPVVFDLGTTFSRENIISMLERDESETTMLSLANHAPSSHTDEGEKGQIYYDTNYLYICVAENTWRRIALVDF